MPEEPHTDKPSPGSTSQRDKAVALARHCTKRVGRFALNAGGELLAVAVGVAVLAVYLANVFLTRQTTDLGFVEPTITRLIAESFDGADAQFESLNITWRPARDKVEFTARDVHVTDAEGRLVQSLSRLSATVATETLRSPRPQLRNVEVDGGEVTWLQKADGSITAGLGGPDSVGGFGPVYRGGRADNSGMQQDWLDGFQSVIVRDSRVNVINAETGLHLRLAVDALSATRDDQAIAFSVRGRAVDDNGRTDGALDLSLRSDDAMQSWTGQGQVTDLRLDRLSPEQGRFSVLQGFALPLSATGRASFSRDAGLQAAALDLTTGSGFVSLAGVERGIRSVRFVGELDPGEQVMMVSTLGIASDTLSLQGSGVVRDVGRLSDGDVGTSPRFDLAFGDARIDLAPIYKDPLVFASASVAGQIDLDTRSLDLDRLTLSQPGFDLTVSGQLRGEEEGLSKVDLRGGMDGTMTPDQFLALWPANAAGGARRWLERSILGGSIDALRFETRLDDIFFADPVLTNERLSVDFAVSRGRVRYIETMTPLENARAVGRIRGNTMSVDVLNGAIGSVAVKSGRIDIPRLMPKGGDILIEAEAEGPTEALLALADQPPFGYMTRYGVSPSGFGGRGELTLSVQRPLLEFFDPARIVYGVEGRFTEASAPMECGGWQITDADVAFRGGSEGLFLDGVADLGPWRANIVWEERYGQNGAPTVYAARGTMPRDTLDALGVGLRDRLGGGIGVDITATGQGLDIRDATILLDLEPADLALGTVWAKPMGVPGTATAQLARSDTHFDITELNISAPGLDMSGAVRLQQDLALDYLRLDRFAIDDVVTGSGLVTRTATRGAPALKADMRGDFFDASGFVQRALEREPGGLGLPILVDAEVAELRLADGYSIVDAVVSADHDGTAMRSLVLGGDRPAGPLTMFVVETETGRTASLRVPDLSSTVSALFGRDTTRGGTLAIDATLPAVGEPGATLASVRAADFEVVDAPALAQILSLASLSGLLDTLSGSGLAFDELSLNAAWRDGQVSVRDARMSGPALGMTAEGEVDLESRQVDMEGAVVPAYTANSLLSDLPLIGGIFTDKDGEGVFALTYTMRGPFERAQVTVNPLSALTPGFLRGIFRSKRDDLPDTVDAELAEQIEAVRPAADSED